MGKTFSRISGLFSFGSKEPPAPESNEHQHTFPPDQTPLGQTTYPLATPRSPLRRTKRSASPSPAPPEEPLAKRVKEDVQYINFAFLKDDFTISFIRRSKVMFIMKGLPGSGKSFVSQEIQKAYPDSAVCSADHYFMHQGVYIYEREKLKDAHEYCQQQAASAARRNTHVIVIDNSCVQNWEMKFYLKLARTHRYIPVVVEPQTPWAMVPSELVVKGVHGVPEEIIANKVKSYQPVQPVYYGWFLNNVDSEKISSIGQSLLQQALEIQDFVQEFLQTLQVSSCEDLLNAFTWNSGTDGGSILHATSKFTARGKGEGAAEYISSPLVNQSLGKCFSLCIIGFVITTRTIGARLKLTEKQLQLWAGNDNEDPPPVTSLEVIEETTLNNSYYEESNSNCIPAVPTLQRFSTERFHPTSGKGSRAHLTLACAPDIKPVTTGFDLIRVVRAEQYALNCDNQEPATYIIEGGILRNYGNGIWVVYPQCEMFVSSLFSAFY